MYSEEIKHSINSSDDYSCENSIRNNYFENRNCLTNVLDFLNQEVVILPSKYFSYLDGITDVVRDGFIDFDLEDEETLDWVVIIVEDIEFDNGYHLSVLDNYLTIVANNKRCIFTNKNMNEGEIIGTIIWVKNFEEILEKKSDRNLKRISNAIVHPVDIIIEQWNPEEPFESIDLDFFLFMEVYKPETIFKYTIDSHMENICLDVYNELVKINLNYLVDKYISNYEKCDGYEIEGEDLYSTKLCECGRLRALCYLDL
jgi:hypothetical protein